MNWWFKIGSIVALVTTLSKLVAGAGVVLPGMDFVAAHSNFFYALALGVIVASWTKRIVVILLVVAGAFLGLTALGV